jgi:hypothetical protein
MSDAQQALQQAQQQARQEHEQRKERTAHLTNLTLRNTESSTPTPTQEENDLAKLGLLHPDEKTHPNNPEMPVLHAQQAYLLTGENKPDLVTPQSPQHRQAVSPPRRPEPPPERAVPRPERS